jgi:hypothetical protein
MSSLLFDLLIVGTVKSIQTLAESINSKAAKINGKNNPQPINSYSREASMECLAFDGLARPRHSMRYDEPDMSSPDTFDENGPNW